MKPSDLMLDIGRPVSYYPKLSKKLGGATATLLFCQLFYWQDKADENLGVYKTSEDLETETGLTYREQVTARKALKDVGVLIETNKRLEHRIYYKIDLDAFNELMSGAPVDSSGGEFPNDVSAIREQQMRSSGSDVSAVREETKTQFDPTENTTEITTENLSLSASVNETLPAVQNALATGRVTPMNTSLRGAFMMSLFWEPGADFEKYARMLGLTNPTYTEAQLNEFRIYWEPTGRCFHHTQWIQKFVQRLKSESNRGLTNDQRNADVRAGSRPAANSGSAYQRGLAAMEQVSSACGNNDFWGNYAARLSGELGISPVRDPLANDANPIDDSRGSGRVFDGDCQNLSDSEGDA